MMGNFSRWKLNQGTHFTGTYRVYVILMTRGFYLCTTLVYWIDVEKSKFSKFSTVHYGSPKIDFLGIWFSGIKLVKQSIEEEHIPEISTTHNSNEKPRFTH
jgi:hypothetical protein